MLLIGPLVLTIVFVAPDVFTAYGLAFDVLATAILAHGWTVRTDHFRATPVLRPVQLQKTACCEPVPLRSRETHSQPTRSAFWTRSSLSRR